MRELIERYALICRNIAAERMRLPNLTGQEHAAAVAPLETLENARLDTEQRALRLRESLLKDGFALDGAQLTTVEDAEGELEAGLAQRSA
ncbi:MAG TPA: hypothetical protein VHU80_21710 [Polyangiaceae bacterium]|jgi:hypothetical protein|nr:hypothetical protein [Polyangiaceae bacterium]